MTERTDDGTGAGGSDTEHDQPGATAGARADRPRVLVPIEVLEGESIPEGVHELLANAHVVLLGYHVLPEQTPPGQARIQFEERAQRKLEQFEDDLESAGAIVDRRLVFTHDERQTIDRQIYEHDCLAVLVPNATEPPRDVLVAIRGTVSMNRLVELVAGLFADTDVQLTLYHVVGSSTEREDGQRLLDEARIHLIDRGVEEGAVDTWVEEADDTVDAVADVAEQFDAVVMGETDPSVTTFVFGMPAEKVAERFLGPVLVVQRERTD